ncbi:interference hedgehog isoform X1 [Anopheles gambiae]|uniref:Interference hedgehog n=1 Tax=Anopheles coluzzii TaxID=1518534 RepID=A0A6E8VB41_ANOCL|nr:interference hedgehog-like isoform X1 [Anopheles coluzzii]XP_040241337.2 interference hedgehog-like isoform X1 [Anopheles coluzzii]XP_040241338.2 interference hedgehog-like isoform X1 [Anopheles coluzzii]XP_061508002.1 interference hedgehog isoform X1 [Anopheles gambiae]XP_061508003.1 interference hedgehog isoform X1 [Anopheles gambiae]XP_061508004.1 interference hedgehog isoform X1 [Anopheles gambiae]XP_061508005.1 interference hedgehog isoform X1 [Anopheles gambiae]XP_061508006.1 interf
MCSANDRLSDTATHPPAAPLSSTMYTQASKRPPAARRPLVSSRRRSCRTQQHLPHCHRCSRWSDRRISHSLLGLCLLLTVCILPTVFGSPQSSHSHHSHHSHGHHHQTAPAHGGGTSGSVPPSSQQYSGGSSGRSSGGSGLGLYIIRAPESTIAPADDEVLFECELNLMPEQLDWRFRAQGTAGQRKDYVLIQSNHHGYNATVVDGRYKLRVSVSESTIGEYQCVAWFGASAIASIPARLTLATIGLEAEATGVPGRHDRVPTTMRRIQPQQHFKVFPGNSIIIDCGDIVSNPPPIWSYYKDGMTIYPNVTQLQTGRRLILASLAQRDTGTYWCSAVNSITGSEVILPQRTTVTVDYVPRSAPRAFTQPQNVSVLPGDTALLECPGVGNPVPVPAWTRANGIPLNVRARIQDYGLQLSNVHPEDAGQYLCRLQNGIDPPLLHSVWLTVLEPPRIVAPPRSTLTNESDSLELECIARGSPHPDIYWMINGDYTEWDGLIRTNGTRLIIQSVEKRHAGIVQCFARNAVGEASEGNLLQVIPKQIPGGIGTTPLGSVPSSPKAGGGGGGGGAGGDHSPKRKGGKKHKNLVMIPPSRPNITRLSDESVMVRWSVPSSDGLPIQFFKVQYRMLGDPTKNIARTQWMTENEDIPPYTRSYEVNNLKSDHLYRFRIVAVYSNNDNKEGAASGKFHLQRGSQLGLTKNHLLAPTLTRIEPVSQHAVVLQWQFPQHLPHPIDGFYAYYRPATTAGEYSKATVDSSTARHFKIDHLEPGTAYEFKLQSFTASAASDFSAILTGRTLKPPTPPPTVPTVIAAAEGPDGSQVVPVNYLLVIGCVLIVSVLLVLFLCCCFSRRKKRGHGADEPDAKVHIPVDQNGFAGAVSNGGPRGPPPPHHKTRTNGMNGRMNITPNPLAQDGDKVTNRTVMELRFLPNTLVEGDAGLARAAGTATANPIEGGWRRKKRNAALDAVPKQGDEPADGGGRTGDGSDEGDETTDPAGVAAATLSHEPATNNNHQSIPNQQQQHHLQQQHIGGLPPLHHPSAATVAMNSCGIPQAQQQQHQQQQQQQEQLMLASMPHRRTLERTAVRPIPNGATMAYGVDPKLVLDGGQPPVDCRQSSIRRTRRGSGSVPGSPRIGRGPSSEFLQQQQQQQQQGVTVARSPMPMRAAGMKRPGATRLGRAENMSSGSLNSIEV